MHLESISLGLPARKIVPIAMSPDPDQQAGREQRIVVLLIFYESPPRLSMIHRCAWPHWSPRQSRALVGIERSRPDRRAMMKIGQALKPAQIEHLVTADFW